MGHFTEYVSLCRSNTHEKVMPDAQYAPKFSDDVFINGDGQVDGMSVK